MSVSVVGMLMLSGSALAKHASLTLKLPAGTVAGGQPIAVTGVVRSAPRGARVVADRKSGRRWASVGASALKRGKFSIRFMAPATGSWVVRARLVRGKKTIATSASRTLRVASKSATGAPVSGASSAVEANPESPGGAPAPAGDASSDAPATPAPAPAPEGPLDLTGPAVALGEGSSVPVAVPGPLVTVASLDGPAGDATRGLSVTAADGHLVVSALAGAAHGSSTTTVTGVGCTSSDCDRAFVLHLPVTVTGIAAPAGALNDLPRASPDRLAAAVAHQLGDQLIISVGTADAPGTRAQADAAAAAAGATVSGGFSDSGVYAVRWTSPQDLTARTTQLLAAPNITNVSPSTVGLYGGDSAIPVAPAYDQPQWTWPYKDVDAEAAWTKTTGSGVTVGIIDEGNVYANHEDLSVQTIGISVPAFHATHVAGLACAKANAVGVVGMAQGCPIVSIATGDAGDDDVYAGMEALAHIGSVKVVNVSLGLFVKPKGSCGSVTQLSQILTATNGAWKDTFRKFFAGVGKNIIWTLSAGNNCLPTVASNYARSWNLDNVITVAASNSDHTLASFSDYGNEVEVAAPGGVSTSPVSSGVMSTTTDFGACPPWAGCGGQCPPGTYCGSYAPDYGTSMAAPQVAGITALARSEAPGADARQIGKCIVSTAGTGSAGSTTGRSALPAYGAFQLGFSGAPTPIVNANAAVNCAKDLTTPPPSTTGSWTLHTTSASTLPGSITRVDCISATDCRAVGSLNGGTLAARWNGSTWTVQSTPNPASATSSSLRDVSCSAADACTAVGVAQDGNGGFAFAERWNGTSWTLQSTAVPADANDTSLSSVECTSATNCEAVGSYNNDQGILTGTPLAMRWNGSSWAVQTTPLPSGGVFSGLAGLGCSSATFCVAVGYFDRGIGTYAESVTETWNGTSWSAQATPMPANTETSQMSDVDCFSSSACTAVGRRGATSQPEWLPLVARYDGTAWSVQPAATPGGSGGTYLRGISCASASICTAVGYWLDASNANHNKTLAERWSASTWSIEPTPNPPSSTSSNDLGGVSCTATTACVAVGSSSDLPNPGALLTETYSG